jgi:TolB-like protein/Flp pilus assembly protein TadD
MAKDSLALGEGHADGSEGAKFRPAFVSYASSDASVADLVVQALETAGISSWIAPRDAEPGSHYADEIIQAINEATILVLVLSANSIASPHVIKEVERASSKRRAIITLRLDSTALTRTLEYFLSDSQWIDWQVRGQREALRKLVEAAGRLLAENPNSPRLGSAQPQIHPTSVRTRRSLLVGSIAVIATLALITGVIHWRGTLKSGAPKTDNQPQIAAKEGAAVFEPPPNSIAVLPFVNISNDPKQDYFSDGVSEELINTLAGLTELKVIARTSAFSFKGHETDIATISRKLNVRNILEGSVRRSDKVVRITAQLIDSKTGFHLWSKTYDRRIDDIFKIQADVAQAVALHIEGAVVGGEFSDRANTRSAQAYDAYLRCVHLYGGEGSEEHRFRSAMAAIDQAIALDPNFADAYAKRAALMSNHTQFENDIKVRAEMVASALAAARTAVLLAPDRGYMHMRLGETLALRLDFKEAAAEFRQAISLSPGVAAINQAFAIFAVDMGLGETAALSARRAVELDPESSDAHSALAYVLYSTKQYSEAIKESRILKQLDSGGSDVDGLTAEIYLASGQAELARGICENPQSKVPDYFRPYCLAIAYHILGRREDAEHQLAQMKSLWGDSNAFSYAEIYAMWGDKQAALGWLSKAESLKDAELSQLKSSQAFDSIRDDLVFKGIEGRMNFPAQL